MVDSNYTHLLVIADRSGSMDWDNLYKEMESALNLVFKEQSALPGKCLVDYVQFDTVHETVYEDRPVSEAKAVIQPRYGTALLDAVGKAASDLGRKLARLPEAHRPGLVQVLVVTDGGENSSVEWTGDKVRALIKQQEDEYNWDFVFLGASLDDVNAAHSYGFSGAKSMTYDTGNTESMAFAASSYVTRGRQATLAGASTKDNAFTTSERDAQKKK